VLSSAEGVERVVRAVIYSQRARVTHKLSRAEELVSTGIQTQGMSGTYELSSAERTAHQDSKIKPARWADAHELLSAKRGSRQNGEESQQASSTHDLSCAEGGTSQDRQIKPTSEGH
jgi:hypothetical protein